MDKIGIAMQPSLDMLMEDTILDALAERGVLHLSVPRELYDLEDAVLAQRWAAMKARGMVIVTTHLPFGGNNGTHSTCSQDAQVHGDTIAMWQRYLRRMAITGVHSTPLHTGGCMQPLLPQSLRDNLARTLEAILPVAQDAGVIIALENTFFANPPQFHGVQQEPIGPHSRLNDDCALLASFVRDWNHPQLKLCFDIGHSNIYGHEVMEDLRIMTPDLALLHLHDNDGNSDQHIAPGLGTIEWKPVAAHLKAIGFDGGIYAEVLRDPDPEIHEGLRTPDMLAKHCQMTRTAITTMAKED